MSDRAYFTVHAVLDSERGDIARHGAIDCILMLRFPTSSASDEEEAMACAVRTLGALRLTDRVESMRVVEPGDRTRP